MGREPRAFEALLGYLPKGRCQRASGSLEPEVEAVVAPTVEEKTAMGYCRLPSSLKLRRHLEARPRWAASSTGSTLRRELIAVVVRCGHRVCLLAESDLLDARRFWMLETGPWMLDSGSGDWTRKIKLNWKTCQDTASSELPRQRALRSARLCRT